MITISITKPQIMYAGQTISCSFQILDAKTYTGNIVAEFEGTAYNCAISNNQATVTLPATTSGNKLLVCYYKDSDDIILAYGYSVLNIVKQDVTITNVVSDGDTMTITLSDSSASGYVGCSRSGSKFAGLISNGSARIRCYNLASNSPATYTTNDLQYFGDEYFNSYTYPSTVTITV